MNSRKFLWGNSRRYNSWRDYFVKKTGGRVQKVVVNAGFSCPNRDGTIGHGGCKFCNNEGFSPSYCHTGDPVRRQIDLGIEFLEKRYKKPEHYIAYFQSYSNTHASLQILKERYQQALSHPRIIGLIAGTRPDCVDEQKLDYLAELSKSKMVILEYGLESCFNETLLNINRGHTFEQTVEALRMTAQRGLHSGVHVIFGLPGESRQMMLSQADIISRLPVNSVKFHQLQIVKGTSFEREYADDPGRFNLFSLDDYISFATTFAERLRPDISIERFSGEVPPAMNAGPSWGLRSDQILQMIEKEFLRRDSWQGKFWQAS